MSRRLPILIHALLLLGLLFAVGCEMETRIIRPAFDNLPVDQYGSNPHYDGNPQNQGQSRAQNTWTIPLDRFEGPHRYDQARDRIAQLQRETNLDDLWIEDVDGTATVYRGRYPDPNHPEARQLLRQTRGASLDDEQPYADARLVPLGAGEQRIDDPHNLQQFRGYFTLQIGYYDEHFDGDRRDAAEVAVNELREDGHEAYYYHGPHRSMITVGLFTEQEAKVMEPDPLNPQAQVQTYSRPVRELQEEFPYNLANGVTMIEYRDGEEIGEQTSVLVRVP